MTLTPGAKLGPYEILSQIGAGGMGEVYRAHDPRVGRDVAIKVSSEQFSDRFTREVHAVAALNHSNVCTLFDVGPNYLVMELVEGPTLADRIKQGPIPLEESLEIARQIADALEAAHEKGIVHRDLKPGNIKIRPDGTLKVLDFGLAKVEEAAAVSLETSPTLSVVQTAAGVLLGTAAYMSPEQARGKSVDKRADIWAFGVVLYEMLTGRRLFSGDTVSDTLASVLKEAPEFEKIPTKVKPLLHSCLERNPANRLRDIGDAWKLLESAQEAIPGSSGPVKKPWLAWTIAALSVLIALALGFALFRKPVPGPSEVMRFEIPFPDKVLPLNVTPSRFALSPDGRRLVFAAASEDGSSRLWLRSIESLEARPLPGTESGISPFWSHDGRFIAFQGSGKLKRMDLSGSPPQTICDNPSPGFLSGGSWNQNDVIIFGGRNGIFRVSAAGGSPSLLTKTTPSLEIAHTNPIYLPDGQNFLYQVVGIPDKVGLYLGSLENQPESPGKRLLATPLTALQVTSQNSGSGQLLFIRE